MHQLSKTNFMKFLDCKEELWMQKNIPGEKSVISAELQFSLEQGNLVDQMTRQLFHPDDESITVQHLAENERFKVLADFTRTKENKHIDLIEAKGSTSVKPEHVYDVAFQKMVFEQNGSIVDRCFLIHVNKEFVFEGEIVIKQFFVEEDITDKVEEIIEDVIKLARKASEFINGPEPKRHSSLGCSNKKFCPFLHYRHSDWPAYSILDIARLKTSKARELYDLNVFDVLKVPVEFPLSQKQKDQVDLAKTNKIKIDKKSIRAELSKLEYPLYFLDYETFNYVLPYQKGYRPYLQMVFQYSLHTVHEDGSRTHHEYLLNSKNEPVENLLEDLQSNLDIQQGTVIVWNKGFETARNREMAELHPQFKTFLFKLNARVFDLMDIFKNGFYLHPKLKGKYSIKVVLPVLCPDLSYKTLQVQEGMQAVVTWHHWTEGNYEEYPKEKTRAALLEYCKLDTFAMLRIWEELRAMT